MTNSEIIVNLATIIAEQRLEISELKTEVTHLHHELIATMSDDDTPQTEETEAERLDRIDNEIEDAWARIKELTPQTDCGWGEPITVSHREERED